VIVVDAQVHAYERDHPGRPWAGKLPGPSEVTSDDLVDAMAEAGIDAALVVSPWTLYGSDPSYAVEVHRTYPDRFRLITPIDPYSNDAGDRTAAWGGTPGAVGIRLMAGVMSGFQAGDQEVRSIVHAAVGRGFPVCVFCPQQLSIADQLARLYPDAQFVLDHLGLMPALTPPPPPDPFAALDGVLALASYPNIAIKVTGLCTLSHAPFPFRDLWEPLGRVFEAFGIDRCMWGTDWTRAVDFVSYAESVDAFRDHLPLSAEEREALMGGTARRIFGWAALA
jgi:predicted TIM-barrel fold metal-dependent hydrolase